MRANVIGIVGGIIAFISLALPWWTTTRSTTFGMLSSLSFSIYPYQVTASAGGQSLAVTVDIWYGGTALTLLVLGGFLGIIGSLVRTTRMVLVAGGLLALLSILIFAAGLQNELWNLTFMQDWPAMDLFSNINMGGFNYTAFLSYGYWLGLASAVIMLIASLRKPKPSAPPIHPLPPT